jgi:hypothetical protein
MRGAQERERDSVAPSTASKSVRANSAPLSRKGNISALPHPERNGRTGRITDAARTRAEIDAWEGADQNLARGSRYVNSLHIYDGRLLVGTVKETDGGQYAAFGVDGQPIGQFNNASAASRSIPRLAS